VSLTDLSGGFRDTAQRRRAQAVIQERLADDRKQNECLYLTRFAWQLLMSYQEVTTRELRTHVGAAKLEAVAYGPNEVWSWDITKLAGPARGVYYDLYVMLDIYSRYVVGWQVASPRPGSWPRCSSPTPSPASAGHHRPSTRIGVRR
jgi:transposase InsO family protein